MSAEVVSSPEKSCEYFQGYTITPERITWKTKIYDIYTGQIVGQKDFEGGKYDRPENLHVYRREEK